MTGLTDMARADFKVMKVSKCGGGGEEGGGDVFPFLITLSKSA